MLFVPHTRYGFHTPFVTNHFVFAFHYSARMQNQTASSVLIDSQIACLQRPAVWEAALQWNTLDWSIWTWNRCANLQTVQHRWFRIVQISFGADHLMPIIIYYNCVGPPMEHIAKCLLTLCQTRPVQCKPADMQSTCFVNAPPEQNPISKFYRSDIKFCDFFITYWGLRFSIDFTIVSYKYFSQTCKWVWCKSIG